MTCLKGEIELGKTWIINMNLTTLPYPFWDYDLESCNTHFTDMVSNQEGLIRSYEIMLMKKYTCEDTSPSEITSKIPIEVEGFEPPQEEVIPVRRSERTHRALDRLCLNVEAKEHSLGDLNEPTSYKAAMLDYESNKWIDAMNAEIQSMMDNM
ncbi:hypothetical protein Tco_0591893 [Tanacetum coccineum]